MQCIHDASFYLLFIYEEFLKFEQSSIRNKATSNYKYFIYRKSSLRVSGEQDNLAVHEPIPNYWSKSKLDGKS